MKGSFVPSAPEVLREAVIVLVGAAIAAMIVSNIPSLKRWFQANSPTGCDCNR